MTLWTLSAFVACPGRPARGLAASSAALHPSAAQRPNDNSPLTRGGSSRRGPSPSSRPQSLVLEEPPFPRISRAEARP